MEVADSRLCAFCLHTPDLHRTPGLSMPVTRSQQVVQPLLMSTVGHGGSRRDAKALPASAGPGWTLQQAV